MSNVAIWVAAIGLLKEVLPKLIELMDPDHPRTEITEQEVKDDEQRHNDALEKLKEIQ